MSREVVDASSLELFKVRLDRAFSSLIKCEVFLPVAGGIGVG